MGHAGDSDLITSFTLSLLFSECSSDWLQIFSSLEETDTLGVAEMGVNLSCVEIQP
jgi:hypothetical protein